MTPAIVRLWPGPLFRSRLTVARAASDWSLGPSVQAAKILIVEDNALLAIDIEDTLRAAGYDVVGVAASAEEALKIAEEHRPTIAVMDIRLDGEVDGIDLAVMILDRYGTRSIFASAHSAPEMKARAVAAHPAGWLTKPFAMQDVVHAVAAALAPKRS